MLMPLTPFIAFSLASSAVPAVLAPLPDTSAHYPLRLELELDALAQQQDAQIVADTGEILAAKVEAELDSSVYFANTPNLDQGVLIVRVAWKSYENATYAVELLAKLPEGVEHTDSFEVVGDEFVLAEAVAAKLPQVEQWFLRPPREQPAPPSSALAESPRASDGPPIDLQPSKPQYRGIGMLTAGGVLAAAGIAAVAVGIVRYGQTGTDYDEEFGSRMVDRSTNDGPLLIGIGATAIVAGGTLLGLGGYRLKTHRANARAGLALTGHSAGLTLSGSF